MNQDGSDLYALTRPVTTLVDEMPSNVSPTWSPDGQHIVYVSSRQPDNEHGPWRLWVMDANGANKRQLPIDIALGLYLRRRTDGQLGTVEMRGEGRGARGATFPQLLSLIVPWRSDHGDQGDVTHG